MDAQHDGVDSAAGACLARPRPPSCPSCQPRHGGSSAVLQERWSSPCRPCRRFTRPGRPGLHRDKVRCWPASMGGRRGYLEPVSPFPVVCGVWVILRHVLRRPGPKSPSGLQHASHTPVATRLRARAGDGGGAPTATDGDADLALALQLQDEENERAQQARGPRRSWAPSQRQNLQRSHAGRGRHGCMGVITADGVDAHLCPPGAAVRRGGFCKVKLGSATGMILGPSVCMRAGGAAGRAAAP